MREPRDRSVGLGTVAALLLVQAVLILGGVLYMLNVFGDELDTELDRQVTTVQSDIRGDLEDVRRSVIRQLRRELDARLPPAP